MIINNSLDIILCIFETNEIAVNTANNHNKKDNILNISSSSEKIKTDTSNISNSAFINTKYDELNLSNFSDVSKNDILSISNSTLINQKDNEIDTSNYSERIEKLDTSNSSIKDNINGAKDQKILQMKIEALSLEIFNVDSKDK
jgi:hypothetical protein